MKLFSCGSATLSTARVEPRIATPLGNLLFTFDVEGSPAQEPAYEIYDVHNEGHVWCWQSHALVSELLICKTPYHLIEDLEDPIDDCWMGVWRFQAQRPLTSMRFACLWDEGYYWNKGGNESGQGLAAQTWRNDSIKVSLGTEDEEALALRASRDLFLPPRLTDYYGFTFEGLRHDIEYLQNGLAIPIPAIQAGEHGQYHFITAWSHELADMSTWFAVDFPSQILVDELDCR